MQMEGGVTETSRNDVSPNEYSGTPGPLDKSSRKRNVPGLIPTSLTFCIMLKVLVSAK
jgi:hypothetical protein